MSGLRISAYLQHHPGATAAEVSQALGISTKTVYRHRVHTPERLPTWGVSELALRLWLALGDTGTQANLLHDLGCSRATLYRGIGELRDAGLLVSFRSQATGKTIYRRREEVRDPFDVFAEDDAEVAKPSKDTVATTASRFSQWVSENYPGVPYQVNRRALMGALGKARKDHGITHYQESMALEMWLSKRPRVLGHAPLWRQFLAAYPSLVSEVPTKPVESRERVRPALSQEALERKWFDQTVEMARTIDLELKDRDYEEWLFQMDRKGLYYHKVVGGQPLASVWEPPMSSTGDDSGATGVVVDNGLSGQAQEGTSDSGEDDWSRYFEEEDDSALFHDEDEYDTHQDTEVGPPVSPLV